MRVLTSAEALAEGWSYARSEHGCPRLVAPDGTEFVRAVLGQPSLKFVGDSGQTHFLRPVSLRRGERLLNLVRR